MATTWTPERRAKQSAWIRERKPWIASTGPRTPEGKATASRNAFKGAVRPKLRELARLVREEINAACELSRALILRQ
jgi:hypothetical protein